MTDLHCHILPGVDDGAEDLQEAIEIAKIAEENGIKDIFATPHYIEGEGYNDIEKNSHILDMLKNELRKHEVNIEIHLGNEVYITPEVLNLLNTGKVSTLNNSKYLLIELPMLDIPIYTENIIYELRLNGFIPIIAHPERNRRIIEDPNIIYNFIGLGALAQLNLSSLNGHYGSKIKDTAEILLSHNMIHFVGTDAHHFKTRALKIDSAVDMLSGMLSKEKLKKILYENPKAVINNGDIQVYEPKKYKRKFRLRSIFSFKRDLKR